MPAERVRELNDRFRTTFRGGRVMLTAGVDALPPDVKATALRRVRTFSEFTEDNDLRAHDSVAGRVLGHQRYAPGTKSKPTTGRLWAYINFMANQSMTHTRSYEEQNRERQYESGLSEDNLLRLHSLERPSA
jgi:hypothetical protein